VLGGVREGGRELTEVAMSKRLLIALFLVHLANANAVR
jgi:hypothetical protein